MDRDRIRLAYALLLSLLVHVLLLRLTFDGQGWVQWFGLYWHVPKFDVAALRVLLVPPDTTVPTEVAPAAKPSEQAIVDQPVARSAALTPSQSRSPTPGTFAAGIGPEANASASAKPKTDTEPRNEAKPTTPAEPGTGVQPGKRQSRKEVVAGAVAAKPDVRAEESGNTTSLPVPPPDVIALDRSDEVTWTVPPGIEQQAPEKAVDVVKQEAFPQEGQRQAEHKEEARENPITQEPADTENPRLEAEREEAARQAAAQENAQRQEAARLEAERQDAERQAAAQLEAQRQEAVRLEAERQEAERQAAARLEAQRREAVHLEAERQEAERQAAAQLESQRQEAARQAAAQQEAARAETARVQAEREEASRQAAAQEQAQREEAARQAAAEQEAQRQEAARQAAAQEQAQREEAARQAAAEQEAARAETARVQAEREQASRQAAAQQEAHRQEAARQYEAKRDERLRAIGRQLDEEAAQRTEASNAARTPNALPLSLSTARRIKLWGRYHVNVELVRYAETWARKIQFDTPLETVREIAKRPHTAPMVTVAIRRDGSVESVTIEVSSGVAQVDEALRRIVEDRRPYQPFQPELARDFDVIEIRRTWHFGSAVQLD